MAGRFPGMDPYIEALGSWQDFHNRVVTYINDMLNDVLPDDYAARTDERVQIVGTADSAGPVFRPDVLIGRGPTGGRAEGGRRGGAATLEPDEVAVRVGDLEEIRETWVEVVRLPDQRLITVVEVLSPTNKAGPGRVDYLAKRAELIGRGVHLVEVDLLLSGHRMPMERWPAGDYSVVVARGERRPVAQVYAWTVRDPLPVVPIPLEAPDPDVPLDLAVIVTTAYERGRYGRLIRYDRPLGLPMAAADRDWAEGTARGEARG